MVGGVVRWRKGWLEGRFRRLVLGVREERERCGCIGEGWGVENDIKKSNPKNNNNFSNNNTINNINN